MRETSRPTQERGQRSRLADWEMCANKSRVFVESGSKGARVWHQMAPLVKGDEAEAAQVLDDPGAVVVKLRGHCDQVLSRRGNVQLQHEDIRPHVGAKHVSKPPSGAAHRERGWWFGCVVRPLNQKPGAARE